MSEDFRSNLERIRELTESLLEPDISAAIFQRFPDPILVVDEKMEILMVNKATENVFGYDRHDLFGVNINILVPERFRQSHTQYMGKYLQQPDERDMNIRSVPLYARCRDGAEFQTLIHLIPLRTPIGNLITVIIRNLVIRKSRHGAE